MSNYPDDIMRTIHDPANPLNEDEPDCEHEKIKVKDYHFDNYGAFNVIFKCTKCHATTTATIDLGELTDWEEEE